MSFLILSEILFIPCYINSWILFKTSYSYLSFWLIIYSCILIYKLNFIIKFINFFLSPIFRKTMLYNFFSTYLPCFIKTNKFVGYNFNECNYNINNHLRSLKISRHPNHRIAKINEQQLIAMRFLKIEDQMKNLNICAYHRHYCGFLYFIICFLTFLYFSPFLILSFE